MGNLVTNGLILSGPRQVLIRALSLMTPEEADPLLAASVADRVYARFRPDILVPEPAVIAATKDGQLVDIGLAALSTNGMNYLRTKQDRDPFLSEMPPAYQETADGILKKLGVETLRGDALLAAVERRVPGALKAGRQALAAHAKTGEFGWYDWRRKHWGARAFSEDVRIESRGDDLCLRFDTVNEAPLPWLSALASACPELRIEGASFDEDTDLAVIFRTLDSTPGDLGFEEQNDEDGVLRARTMLGLGPCPDEEEEYEP